jgi:hypothetical protein
MARGGTPELAAYQQYDGQLQLAETMDELVERVRVQLAEPPRQHAPAPVFGADAGRLLPRLWELYAEQTNLFDRYVHLEQRRHAG